MRRLLTQAISVAFLALIFPVASVSAEDSVREFSFELNGQHVEFRVTRPSNSFVNYLRLPNGEELFLRHGIYAKWVDDIVQVPDGSIFGIMGSNISSGVSIFNGERFYQLLSHQSMVQNRSKQVVKARDNKLLVYPLLPPDGDDVFVGLLVFHNEVWQYHTMEYTGDEQSRRSADSLKLIGNRVQIKHSNWDPKNQETQYTYFSLDLHPHRTEFYHYANNESDPNLKPKPEPLVSAKIDGQTLMLSLESFSTNVIDSNRLTISDATGHFASQERSNVVVTDDQGNSFSMTIEPTMFKASPTDSPSAVIYEITSASKQTNLARLQRAKTLTLQEVLSQ